MSIDVNRKATFQLQHGCYEVEKALEVDPVAALDARDENMTLDGRQFKCPGFENAIVSRQTILR